MSLRSVQARFLASEATGDVRSVEVFGHELTEKFSKVEVDDLVFGKLSANPHIEVKGGALDLDNSGEAGGSLTVAEMKTRLADLGVDVPPGAKKADLQVLLSAAEAAHEAAEDDDADPQAEDEA